MDELLLKINQLLTDMNATERKIADYVLANPYCLLKMPIAQLSQTTGVSQAAWVRFFKMLGFSGLKEVKRTISFALMATGGETAAIEEPYADVKGPGTPEGLCRSVLEQSMRSLRETDQILDFSQLKKAVNAICMAQKVAFFGVGTSGLVACDAQYKFVRIGIHAVCFLDFHVQLTFAATMQEGDVAVMISHSGTTREILDVLEIAKKKGVTVIGLTKYGKSPLSKAVDILLHTSTPEISVRSSAMSSRLAQLLVIDYLFVCVTNRAFEKAERNLHESREAVSGRKTSLADALSRQETDGASHRGLQASGLKEQ